MLALAPALVPDVQQVPVLVPVDYSELVLACVAESPSQPAFWLLSIAPVYLGAPSCKIPKVISHRIATKVKEHSLPCLVTAQNWSSRIEAPCHISFAVRVGHR